MAVIKRKVKRRYFKKSLVESFEKPKPNDNPLNSVFYRSKVAHFGLTSTPDDGSRPLGYAVRAVNHLSGTNRASYTGKAQATAATKTPLLKLTAAALILPGLFQPTARSAEEDSVDFQYSHYQEGRREGTYTDSKNIQTGAGIRNIKVPNSRNPIEVDSLHGSARISLTDRVKFAFNYTEDTWAGATPYGSAPERSGALSYKNQQYDDNGNPIITGASAYDAQGAYFDSKGNPLYQVVDPTTGQASFLKDRPVHVMGYASPETRKQGDFKLGYEWDETALDVGGGISLERDYESRFVNLGGHMDFNQKQTTVNLGLSYTNSDINADLGFGVVHYTNKDAYIDQIDNNPTTGQHTLHGNRQDWATQLGLTQVINKDAVMELGMGYTRSTGFLENPYKVSWIIGIDPDDRRQQGLPDGIVFGKGPTFIEQRPDVRNQWNWTARWAQYVEPMDAALHLDYQFAHDDWGINAHTFAADWVQPLGDGWAVTPRVRYYSQEAADFYKSYFLVSGTTDPISHIFQPTLPANFSSDQRLSGYGTLSGGVTVSKQFAKGVGLEAGFEYYTHQGGLKLGGGGEQDFANFDYWVANAALKVNLSALGQGGSGGSHQHAHHADHPNIPAGVLFGHTLDKAGDIMIGYRYMRGQQGGEFLHGNKKVTEQQMLTQGCPGSAGSFDDQGLNRFDGGCAILPREMSMDMHMLELMYAPTDWLTLMLMPQFLDMDMALYQPPSLFDPNDGHSTHAHGHETGGIGDTGMFALVKLFDAAHHHLHTSLGISAPTGDVGIKLREGVGLKDLDGAYVHYGMQLGSGTWDFKPSLTYTGKTNDWSWGAQVGGTKRLEGSNKSGYALGDIFETSVWGGYDLTRWLSATVRAAYTWQGSIKGHYPTGRKDQEIETSNCPIDQYIRADDLDGDGIPDGQPFLHQGEYNECLASLEESKRLSDANDRPTPMDFPANYGAHYVDIGFGLSATVPSGSLAGNRLSFEWLQPVYTDVNGYQLDRDGALSFTWSYGF
ncbi:MAG: DUF3570 domain-containing protein [Methyloglobulus sp.]|nr:DUF3570 domain-containing protein [Methyloglobulus sp.]